MPYKDDYDDCTDCIDCIDCNESSVGTSVNITKFIFITFAFIVLYLMLC